MMLSSGTITTFLFDLDGVIRIYLDKDTSLIEEKYGLALGTIDEIAFSNDLLIKVTTGKIKRHEWVRMIGIRMNNLQAALEWESRPVYVNREVLDIIRKLRSIGFQVCLVTNGTDNLLNELRRLDIDNEFIHIFNSADLGFAKPSPMVYRAILDFCKLRPENVAYIDDNKENVSEAQNMGITSLQYNGINTLKEWLKNNSLLLD